MLQNLVQENTDEFTANVTFQQDDEPPHYYDSFEWDQMINLILIDRKI